SLVEDLFQFIIVNDPKSVNETDSMCFAFVLIYCGHLNVEFKRFHRGDFKWCAQCTSYMASITDAENWPFIRFELVLQIGLVKMLKLKMYTLYKTFIEKSILFVRAVRI